MRALVYFLIAWAGVAWAQNEKMVTVPLRLPAGERRVAFVIGMSKYKNVRPLQNPPNDADDMEAVLKQLGFEVKKIINEGLGYTQAEIDKFVATLRPNDIVFFYFSGHGVGYKGDNYLLPIDARIECLEEIPKFGFSVNQLQATFRNKRVRNNFLVLDACRSLDQEIYACYSTGKDLLSTKGLLIPQNQLEGDAILYATQQGEVADDNVQQRNGLFTQVLIKYLLTPDLNLFQIMTQTTREVREESLRRVAQNKMKARQLPAVYGNLGLEFVFVKTDDAPKRKEEEERKKVEEWQKQEIARLKAENEALKKQITTTPPDNTRVLTTVQPTMKDNSPIGTVRRAVGPSQGKGAKFLDLPFADMAYIEGGTFQMGDTWNEGENDEKPVHTVTVSSFWMSKYEVTQRQWTQIIGSNPSYFENCDDCPVENVSWDDTQEFLKKLNAREGRSAANAYRLPTEAEWEYAAGGGAAKRTRFGNGKDILDPKEANFDATASYKKEYSVVGEYRSKTLRVGSFEPNTLGLYDMSGNVWEWCTDWYSTYPNSAQTNPKGPASGPSRVLRGGSWDSTPNGARVADRYGPSPVNRPDNRGFRVVSPSQL